MHVTESNRNKCNLIYFIEISNYVLNNNSYGKILKLVVMCQCLWIFYSLLYNCFQVDVLVCYVTVLKTKFRSNI